MLSGALQDSPTCRSSLSPLLTQTACHSRLAAISQASLAKQIEHGSRRTSRARFRQSSWIVALEWTSSAPLLGRNRAGKLHSFLRRSSRVTCICDQTQYACFQLSVAQARERFGRRRFGRGPRHEASPNRLFSLALLLERSFAFQKCVTVAIFRLKAASLVSSVASAVQKPGDARRAQAPPPSSLQHIDRCPCRCGGEAAQVRREASEAAVWPSRELDLAFFLIVAREAFEQLEACRRRTPRAPHRARPQRGREPTRAPARPGGTPHRPTGAMPRR